jgi:integrase
MARGKLPIFERLADDGRLMGYQVKIRKTGFPPVSKQFDKKADAERFAIDTLKAMIDGTWVDRREVDATMLSEALDRYEREVTPSKKGASREKSVMARLRRHKISKKAVSRVRSSDVAGYRDGRLAEGLAGNTVRLELALLSHLFTIGIKEWDWPLTNPVRSIRMPKVANGRDRRLDPRPNEDGKTEENRLITACRASKSRHLRPIVQLAIETGMRQGEILSLQWENIDLDKRVAHLADTKNGEPRDVPLSPAALRVLRDLLPGGGEARPLHKPTGLLFPIGQMSVVHSFSRACSVAGIAGLRFHDLRHEATSRLFERGFGIQQVAAITGHKTLQMLKRYTHLRATDLAEQLAAHTE